MTYDRHWCGKNKKNSVMTTKQFQKRATKTGIRNGISIHLIAFCSFTVSHSV